MLITKVTITQRELDFKAFDSIDVIVKRPINSVLNEEDNILDSNQQRITRCI